MLIFSVRPHALHVQMRSVRFHFSLLRIRCMYGFLLLSSTPPLWLRPAKFEGQAANCGPAFRLIVCQRSGAQREPRSLKLRRLICSTRLCSLATVAASGGHIDTAYLLRPGNTPTVVGKTKVYPNAGQKRSRPKSLTYKTR